MLITFVAGLYDVFVLESKLKIEKNKIQHATGEVNLGLDV
jgi:hypothetical protein